MYYIFLSLYFKTNSENHQDELCYREVQHKRNNWRWSTCGCYCRRSLDHPCRLLLEKEKVHYLALLRRSSMALFLSFQAPTLRFACLLGFDQRVRMDGVVSQIFLLTQSVFEMSPSRLWELQS